MLAERQTLLEEQLKAQGYSADQIADEVEKTQRTKAETEALSLANSVMTKPGDRDQENTAIDLLRANDFTDSAINAAIERQNKTLEERRELLKAQLQAQGVPQKELLGKISEALKTDYEREQEDKRAKQRDRVLGLNKARLAEGQRVGQAVMGTDGTFMVNPEGSPPRLRVQMRTAQGPYKAGWQDIKLKPQTRFVGDFEELAQAIKTGKPLRFSYDHELLLQETLLRASGEIS